MAQGFKVWRHREIFIVSSMPCSEHLQPASDGARARPHRALRRSGPQCSAHKNIGHSPSTSCRAAEPLTSNSDLLLQARRHLGRRGTSLGGAAARIPATAGSRLRKL